MTRSSRASCCCQSVAAGRFDPAAFARRVAALFAEGSDVGAGPGSRGAANRLAAGVPWSEAGAPAPYAGNGSAMRAAPIGLLYGADVEAVVRVAVAAEPGDASGPSMRWRGRGGRRRRSARGDGATRRRSTGRPASPSSPPGCGRSTIGLPGRSSWRAGGRGLQPEAAAAEFRAAGLDPAWADPWRGVSAHVVPSVAWALYAFLHSPDSYREAVCSAIVIGGDTDSLGAMAGALAGVRAGAGALPERLIERLNDRGAWRGPALAALGSVTAEVY